MSNSIPFTEETPAPDRWSRSLLLVSLVAVFGGFLFGYDTAVVNGANEYLKTHFRLTPTQQGFANASAILGCIPGAMFAGFLSDRFGRRKVLFVCAILYAISGVLSAVPRTFPEFVMARLLSGLGIGASSMICPIYIAEMAPKAWRGRLGSLFQFGIVTGIFITLFINARIQGMGDETWNTSTGWRWMLGAEVAPAAFLLALLFFVPESPRWLLQFGNEPEARNILENIGGKQNAEREIVAVREALKQNEGKLSELLVGRYKRPLLIAVLLMAISQFCGINAIMYYSTSIFAGAGGAMKDAFTASTVIGLVNLLFTFVAMGAVDKLGRRPLLIIGLAAQVVALGVVGWMYHQGIHDTRLLAAIVLFIAAFAMSLGPVPWIICSEIFPTKLRGRAMSVATFTIWTSCYIVTQTFPILTKAQTIGPSRIFFGFALVSLAGLIFVIVGVPETKGRSLEEIEKAWTPS